MATRTGDNWDILMDVCGKGIVWKGMCEERGVCGKGCVRKGMCVERDVCGKGFVWKGISA